MRTAIQSHGSVWMFCDERGSGKGFALEVREAITKHMVQTRGLLALPRCRVCACIFGVFGEEVQEDFVVGEERGLGVRDLWVGWWVRMMR